jgi:hypothetical protein
LIWLAIAVAPQLAATAAQAKDESVASGFLADYQHLVKTGPLRDRYLAFKTPMATAMPKIFMQSVGVFPVGAVFEGVDPALQAQTLADAEAALRARLSSSGQLVDTAGPGTALLEVVVTQIQAVEEGRTLLDLVPLRMITGRLKTAAKGAALEASARFELRLTDTATQQVIYESVHLRAGKGIGRAEDPKTRITSESLKPAVDAWASSAADELALKP